MASRLDVLILTDLHLHEWPMYASRTEEGKHSRLMDGVNILYQASDYMDQHNISRGWFLGDVNHIHDKMLYSVQYEFTQWFRHEYYQKRRKWMFLVGNHDRDTTTGEYHCLRPFHGPAEIISTPQVVVQDGFAIACFPWLMDGSSIRDHMKNLGKADIGLFHHDFSDVEYRGRAIGRAGLTKSTRKYYPLALSGHYHDKIVVSPSFTYLGSPMHHDMGDRGRIRGMHHLTLRTDGSSDLQFVPTKFPHFIRIKDTKKLTEQRVRGNFVQIVDTCGRARKKAKEALALGARAAEPIDQAVILEGSASLENPDLSAFDFGAVLSEYVESVETSLKKKKLKKLGLKALKEA